MVSLSQQTDEAEITRLFIEAVNSLVVDLEFQFSRQKPTGGQMIEIATGGRNYGWLSWKETLPADASSLLLALHNAAQMVAVLLENRHQNRLLNAQNTSLEELVRVKTQAQRLAERSLHRSEKRYRRLFEDASIGMFRISYQGKLLDANRSLALMFGYSGPEEMIASVQTVAGDMYADPNTPLIFTEEELPHAAPKTVQRVYKHRNGTTFVGNVHIWPTTEEGSAEICFEGFIEDVTEIANAQAALKQSEEEFRQLFEAESDAIFLIDNQTGRILRANSAAAALYGYSIEELEQMKNTDLSAEPDETRRVTETTPVVKENVVKIALRYHRARDGTLLPVEISGRFFEVHGRPVHIAAIRDIRERMTHEEELHAWNTTLEQRVRDRTAQLEASNRELEAFGYSISHDLRAPLRAMDGFSELLLEDYSEQLDQEGRGYLHRIRSASQRMGQLIDDLLRLSRLTRAELHLEAVNLSEIVRGISLELVQLQPDRQVEWIIAPGVTAQADPVLIYVVLQNLLQNAWKFTSKKEQAVIEFGVQLLDGQATFFIRDNGAGFDMTYVDKLFGVFSRLHNPSEYSGTGIGLAIVHRLIQRHSGRIWARGQVGQGATFFFTIPTT